MNKIYDILKTESHEELRRATRQQLFNVVMEATKEILILMRKVFQDVLRDQFDEDYEEDHNDLKPKMPAEEIASPRFQNEWKFSGCNIVFQYENNSPADANRQLHLCPCCDI
jgi:hypothetical protein